jgi:hypothetical protein
LKSGLSAIEKFGAGKDSLTGAPSGIGVVTTASGAWGALQAQVAPRVHGTGSVRHDAEPWPIVEFLEYARQRADRDAEILREGGADNYLGINRGQLVLVGELQPFSFDPLSARLRGGEARFGCEDGYAQKTGYGLQARSG